MNTPTRRAFLHAAAAATALPAIVKSTAFAAPGRPAPSDRIAMGCIGVGGRGTGLLRSFLSKPDARVVAVCDVKKPMRERAAACAAKKYGGGDCAASADFREILARDDIDAVTIATTDQWHVPAAYYAALAGKDMYCEKPLGVSLENEKKLRDTIRRTGRVFQFGTQERSSRNTRFGCELVLNGYIGEITAITVSSRYSRAAESYPPQPVPDWIDYDRWLGPAPWAPFCPQRVQNRFWFHMSDYALGFIAGCGIHTIDMATWGNGTDLTGPVAVEGVGEFPAAGMCDCATGWDVTLRFANGAPMRFTDGKRNPLGVKFEGTEGTVFIKEEHLGGRVDASPVSLMRESITAREIHLAVSRDHQQNFLDCVKTRGKPVAPIEIAVRSDTLCHLSNIAMRLGRKIRWDPDREVILGDPEAARMLTRPLRPPWTF